MRGGFQQRSIFEERGVEVLFEEVLVVVVALGGARKKWSKEKSQLALLLVFRLSFFAGISSFRSFPVDQTLLLCFRADTLLIRGQGDLGDQEKEREQRNGEGKVNKTDRNWVVEGRKAALDLVKQKARYRVETKENQRNKMAKRLTASKGSYDTSNRKEEKEHRARATKKVVGGPIEGVCESPPL